MQHSIRRRELFLIPIVVFAISGCRSITGWQAPCLALDNGGAYLHSPLPFTRSESTVKSDLQEPAVVRNRSRVIPAPLPTDDSAGDRGVTGSGYRPDEEKAIQKLTKELDETPSRVVPPREEGPRLVDRALKTQVDLDVHSQEALAVNDEVTFKVRLTNRGAEIARDLVIQCDFDEGLAFPGKEERGIIQRLGELSPGESREVELTLRAKSEGSQTALFTARSSTVDAITPVSRKLLVAPQPLFLELSGMGSARVGDVLNYRLTVRNASTKGLTNVRIRLKADAPLKPKTGDGGPEAQSDGWTWSFPEINSGETKNLNVAIECVKTAEAAEVLIEGTADGIRGDTLRATIVILATPKPPMTRLSPPEIDLGEPASF